MLAYMRTYILSHPAEFPNLRLDNVPTEHHLIAQFDRLTTEQLERLSQTYLEAAKIASHPQTAPRAQIQRDGDTDSGAAGARTIPKDGPPEQ